ncbi:nucleotide pyrophosphohydrolase [Streptomyces sp. NPDC101151]|uniref:nucleotide pyrophosphohydrolase n=1 Tax=Streptomyces sp. NPDC101151 TaxID=3366115 RepID=UPI00381B103B
MTIHDLQQSLAQFARERDWEQFHTPKNLVMALLGEAGELAEIFQWLTPAQSRSVMDENDRAQAVRHEMADVLAYLLRLADVTGVDLEQALAEKIELNRQRYPVDLAQGRATKYTSLKA